MQPCLPSRAVVRAHLGIVRDSYQRWRCPHMFHAICLPGFQRSSSSNTYYPINGKLDYIYQSIIRLSDYWFIIKHFELSNLSSFSWIPKQLHVTGAAPARYVTWCNHQSGYFVPIKKGLGLPCQAARHSSSISHFTWQSLQTIDLHQNVCVNWVHKLETCDDNFCQPSLFIGICTSLDHPSGFC